MKQLTKVLFKNDLAYLNDYAVIGGVDEVGRGPLAGPVVVCAVVMPYNKMISGVNDSKQVSLKQRNILAQKIKAAALAYCVEVVDEKVIDEINILNATKLAMKNAIKNLKIKPDLVLVDAIKNLDVDIKTKGIVHGDEHHYSIACASIVAKTERDEMMVNYSKIYPQYEFEKNKGYGTKKHIETIKTFGICDIHRKSFVKNFI